MRSVRLSVAARGNVPYTNNCSPVQLGLNVDGLTDLNGGSPVRLFCMYPQPALGTLGNVPYTNSCSTVQLGLNSLNDMHRVKHALCSLEIRLFL
jgi:hypothetical protein